MDLEKTAKEIYDAERGMYQIERPGKNNPEMTVDDGYQIQLLNHQKRLDAGQKYIGMKIGLTSKAVQNIIGALEPAFGFLTDSCIMTEEKAVSFGRLLQPKVEGELAFIIDQELKGPGITEKDIYDACSTVVPALEICDSRIKDWDEKVPDMIADNGSVCGIVSGKHPVSIHSINMTDTAMTFYKNDQEIFRSTTSAVLGNPVNAMIWLVDKLAEYELALPAGSIVLAGSLVPPVPVLPGDKITASFDGLGSVSVSFTE